MSLSLVAVLIWLGLFQMGKAGASSVGAVNPWGPDQAGAALVNRSLAEKVDQCVRQESDPKCLAVTRQKPGLCLGDQDCLDDTYLILAVKGLDRCEKVAAGEQRVICQAIRQDKVEICLKLSGHKLVECQAVVRRDLPACDALKGQPRTRCRGIWHLAQAVIQGQPGLCEVIPRVQPKADAPNLLRAFCRAVVSMDDKKCQADLRGYCRRSIPIKALSRYACPHIEDAVLRQRCVIKYGR